MKNNRASLTKEEFLKALYDLNLYESCAEYWKNGRKFKNSLIIHADFIEHVKSFTPQRKKLADILGISELECAKIEAEIFNKGRK